jgi:ABC-2 type transport system ATP-binding protein
LISEVGENVIVILSTHIVQDVMELCTNMAIIHQGKVLFAGVPDEAVRSLDGRIWKKFITKAEMKAYEEKHRVISSKLIAGRPLIHIFSEQGLRRRLRAGSRRPGRRIFLPNFRFAIRSTRVPTFSVV